MTTETAITKLYQQNNEPINLKSLISEIKKSLDAALL